MVAQKTHEKYSGLTSLSCRRVGHHNYLQMACTLACHLHILTTPVLPLPWREPLKSEISGADILMIEHFLLERNPSFRVE
jgi:hypothetical protein